MSRIVPNFIWISVFFFFLCEYKINGGFVLKNLNKMKRKMLLLGAFALALILNFNLSPSLEQNTSGGFTLSKLALAWDLDGEAASSAGMIKTWYSINNPDGSTNKICGASSSGHC